MPGKIEVLQVTEPGEAPGLLYGAIDKPRPGGSAAEGWSLDVRGARWATATRSPTWSSWAPARVIHTAPCDAPRPALAAERPTCRAPRRAGSTRRSAALDLRPEFELRLRAVLAGGGRAPARDDHRPAGARCETSFEPRMQPLLVTGPGRSGSTIFMQMLAGHPEILAWPPFEQEPRVVTYWIEVLRALARPDSFMRQVAPAGNLNDDWWLGRRDPRPRALGDADIQAWLAGRGGGGARGVRAIADRVAVRTARRPRRTATASSYFAEKLRNDIVSDLAWELYPAGARGRARARSARRAVLGAGGEREARRAPAAGGSRCAGSARCSRDGSPRSQRAGSGGATALTWCATRI